MIKKAIVYIEKFVNGVLEDKDPFEADPIKGAYEEGSQDVAENIKQGLEMIPDLFSVYTLNPFPKAGGERWEEIACSRTPEDTMRVAEGIVLLFKGQIDIRYEGLGNKVYWIQKEGKTLVHYPLKEEKK
jgi:hypothetical protein